jgi:hypothetical protein
VYYLYHAAPESMYGNELLPLNQMPNSMAEIKKLHLKKYKGREEILERRIPFLDCLWNDVIQFLPFHPSKVFQLQKDLGLISEIYPFKFYEIDLESFDPSKTVVFFKTAVGEENTEVKWLDDVNFSAIQDVPKATIEYYKTLVCTGELPFNYQFVPHVLYKGILDVSGAKIITL